MSTEIRVFQIFYNEETRASLDPDFEPLDNSDSERADWYEYWPIRNYLRRNELKESTYYGFLSPRFLQKTRLRGAQVKDFARGSPHADVVTFSPFPCHGACFLNVFEQGELFHPGLFEVSVEFFSGVDPKVKLDTLITHSRNTVFANFFLAKTGFWKAWTEVFDRLFALAETPGSPLHARLNTAMNYRFKTDTHMKIFVMERAVSFLLASSPAYTVTNFPPFQLPLCPELDGRLADVVMLDALKLAFAGTDDPNYLRLYAQLRDRVLAGTWLADKPQAAKAAV